MSERDWATVAANVAMMSAGGLSYVAALAGAWWYAALAFCLMVVASGLRSATEA